MKAFVKVTKNNNSIRLTVTDRSIIHLLDMDKTKSDERWEIEIIRKINPKQLQEELQKKNSEI